MTRTYLVAPFAMFAAGAGACATDSAASMVILQNGIPGDGCLIQASSSGRFISAGLLHPDSTVGYVFTPVIESRVDASNTVERNIVLKGADVVLEDLDGNEIAAFGQRFAGTLGPGDTVGVGFEITPRGQAEGNYVAKVEIYGDLNGGNVTSEPFAFPVEISATRFEVNIGACDSLEPGFVGETASSACNPLQDGGIECCTSGENLLCPAMGPPEV